MRSYTATSVSHGGFKEKNSGILGLTSVIFRNIFWAYAFVDISLIRAEEL